MNISAGVFVFLVKSGLVLGTLGLSYIGGQFPTGPILKESIQILGLVLIRLVMESPYFVNNCHLVSVL